MSNKNIDLIRQALNAAEASIKLAKQLMTDLETGQSFPATPGSSAKAKAAELPGVVGIFDGENMVSESGETFPVPANYASKSLLVVGDTLKLVEEGKEKRFKQIEHLKRHKTTGILTKKDGKWKVVTPEGSYKVLPAAVSHFGADVGDEVVLHIPATNLTVPWGAIESVKGNSKETEVKEEETTEKEPEKKVETKAKEERRVEKVPEIEVKHEVKKEPEKKPEVKEEVKEVKTEPKKEETKAPEPKKEPVPLEAPKAKSAPAPVEIKAPPIPVPTAPAAVATSAPAVPMEVTPEEDELT